MVMLSTGSLLRSAARRMDYVLINPWYAGPRHVDD
jgi:hypothetical protein